MIHHGLKKNARAARGETADERRPIDRLSWEDIRDATSASAFTKGERYQRQGRVTGLTVKQDGYRVEARVRGSERYPYVQAINIKENGEEGFDIDGECSCPVGFNCKHVAAVLLDVIASTQDSESDDSTGTLQNRLQQDPSPRFVGPAPAAAVVGPPSSVLAPQLAAWIDSLVRIEKTESEDYPPDIRQRLVYVLETEPFEAGPARLLVKPISVRLLKNNTFSDRTARFSPSSISHGNGARFLRPSDREILRRFLYAHRLFTVGSATCLAEEEGVATLEAIIATGRARWGAIMGPIVTRDAPRPGQIVWRLAQDGAQHAAVQFEEDPNLRAVLLSPPWYVDIETGAMGPIETNYPPRVAAAILSAPAVQPGQAEALRAAISRRLPALSALTPPDPGPPEIIDDPPTRGLRLLACELPRFDYGWGQQFAHQKQGVERVPLARPFFRYGSVEIGTDETRGRPTYARNGRIVEVARNLSAERKALARLTDLGLERLSISRPYGVPAAYRNDLALAEGDDTVSWLDILYYDLPALRAEGWEIEVDTEFPVRLVRADNELSAEFREGSGIDWFELGLGVLVDGQRLDLVPALLSAIADPDFDLGPRNDPTEDDPPIYLPLSDGRVLAMPAARLRPILAALHELFSAGVIDPKAKRLGFSALDAGSLADLEETTAAAGVSWCGGERIRELGRLLRNSDGIPRAAIPATFTATLRPYQKRGIDWLQFLRAAGLGGVLADDMGLGKTIQTLAHIAIERASGRMDSPVLVVVPTSLVANWRQEAQRFVPDLKILTLHGTDRKSRFGDIPTHDLVLTTYPLLVRDHQILSTQSWHMIVLDEAQSIKNANAAKAQLVREIEARHRLCLTGTPLENHLGELWSLFAFLTPGFLGSQQDFHRRWRVPIEKRGDNERRLLLARRVRPFLLRRAKSDVTLELPPKTEIVESIEMGAGQRDLYESIRLAMHAKVRKAIVAKGLGRSRILVLDALLKLRQVCCDPRLLKFKIAARDRVPSAKLDRLREMLPDLVEEGRQILLFSQFTSMLALIREVLGELDLPYVLLTGDTRDRDTPIRRFQHGEVPLFLISLKAGGVGLNLTAADTVIHYDPWWNPAVEDQATDRAHRIGQDKPIFVHKLLMADSIEEKMEALKDRKRELATSLFDPAAGTALDLSEADVEALLGPS